MAKELPEPPPPGQTETWVVTVTVEHKVTVRARLAQEARVEALRRFADRGLYPSGQDLTVLRLQPKG